MRIAINRCYGGFSLSHKAILELAKRKGVKLYAYSDDYSKGYQNKKLVPLDTKKGNSMFVHYTTQPVDNYDDLNEHYWSPYKVYENRTDPDLFAVIDKMGKKSWGSCAELEIIEIPDDISYEIEEYDGIEWVAEAHRTWR